MEHGREGVGEGGGELIEKDKTRGRVRRVTILRYLFCSCPKSFLKKSVKKKRGGGGEGGGERERDRERERQRERERERVFDSLILCLEDDGFRPWPNLPTCPR